MEETPVKAETHPLDEAQRLIIGKERIDGGDVNARHGSTGISDAENAANKAPNVDQLGLLVDPKNPWILKALGGPDRLAVLLRSDPQTGLGGPQLNADELKQRQEAYGENSLPEKKTTGLFKIMLMTLDDKVLIILIVAAIISLALGLYERFGEPTEYFSDGTKVPQVDWVEGVAILVAVIIVTVVGSVNDWQKERQFMKLNKKKEERLIEVLRDDSQMQIPIESVSVGDILYVQPGDILPVDGFLLVANDIQCDESSVTGESDTMKKHNAYESMKRLDEGLPASKADCLMISGAKVMQGTGRFMVTAVGRNSMWGRTMLSLQQGTEVTPLQEKLNRIADGIAKFGVWSALILFIVLFIRFLVEITGHRRFADLTSSQKGNKFMDIFIVSVTIVVVAVPEGLPLAVTLALAFATTRMVKDHCLVRVLKSCETMGGATSVCSDKTGTLTQNEMTVVRSLLDMDAWEMDLRVAEPEPKKEKKKLWRKAAQKEQTEKEEESQEQQTEESQEAKTQTDLALQGDLGRSSLRGPLNHLLQDSLCLNSTVYEEQGDPKKLMGSKTEVALLNYARVRCGVPVGELKTFRESRPVVFTLPFDSARKYMLTVVRIDELNYRMLVKGAAEIIAGISSFSLGGSNDTLVTSQMDEEGHRQWLQTIDEYADSALRCIACAYKDFSVTREVDWSQMKIEDLDVESLTLIGILGIQDPLRPGVREAVLQCQRAGVVVRMVTGDNLRTARAISINANIIAKELDPNDVIMEGPHFRELSDVEATKVAPYIKVLARSSPQDKRRLVEILKSLGETVAVTGDGTNDAPALRLADVGFSMGIAGTEVAKEASDIIIMDDNFASIVNALKWGRTVNDAVKKFLQFQLTVNVTAVTLTFISAVTSSDNESVLTAVQLLWVNLIMDTLAALALATDAPTDVVLDRPPDNRKKSLITPTMWKMIFCQAIYQLCVTFVLYYSGRTLFHYPKDMDPDDRTRLSALVFNAFLWMQFFNMFVNRRLDNGLNFFVGLSKNPFFPIIAAIIGGFQVLIMFEGGAAFHIKHQTPGMWATALLCGFGSIPVSIATRFIPDKWIIFLYPRKLWMWFVMALDSIEAAFLWLMIPVIWPFSQLTKLVKRMFGVKDEEEKEAHPEFAEDVDSPKHLVDRHLSFKDAHRTERPASVGSDYKWVPGIERSIAEISRFQKVRGGRSQQLNNFFHKKKQQPTPELTRKQSRTSILTWRSKGSDSHTFAAFMAPMVVGGAVGGWAPTLKHPVTTVDSHSSSA